MLKHSNRFNDRFLRRRLQEISPNQSFQVKDPSREELQYSTMYKGVMFLVSRGHAYRGHATGPSTNPRFGGPPEAVETAIIEDAFKRWKSGMLKGSVKIAAGGPGIIFRDRVPCCGVGAGLLSSVVCSVMLRLGGRLTGGVSLKGAMVSSVM